MRPQAKKAGVVALRRQRGDGFVVEGDEGFSTQPSAFIGDDAGEVSSSPKRGDARLYGGAIETTFSSFSKALTGEVAVHSGPEFSQFSGRRGDEKRR